MSDRVFSRLTYESRDGTTIVEVPHEVVSAEQFVDLVFRLMVGAGWCEQTAKEWLRGE